MPRPAPDKTVTIRFTKRADDKTIAALFKDENGSEQVCFLFANVLETRERKVFLIDHVVTLHESCYVKRTKTSAVVHHPAKNEVYRRFVESPYDGFINVHVHAFAGLSVAFSAIDDEDDLREMAWGYAQLTRGKRACRQKTKVHLLSMVFGQKSLAARGYKPGTPPTLPTIEQVQVLGERFQIIYPTGARTPCLTAEALTTYDRQIKAFGEEGQQALNFISSLLEQEELVQCSQKVLYAWAQLT